MQKISNLLTRTCTGAVYVAVILGGIYLNSPTILATILAILAAQACFEFQSVAGINRYLLMQKIIHALVAALLLFTITIIDTTTTPQRATIILLPYIAYYLFYTIGELYRGRNHPIVELAMAFFAHIYIVAPLALLVLLCRRVQLPQVESLTHLSKTFWVLPLFVFVWISDTGAYIVGSLIGKHRLFERISPKKSIEGFIGGVLFALLAGWAFSTIFPGIIAVYNWLIFALLVAVFSTWGDLFESFVKRTYGVKDSGNILPGHGGVLDRIDSILFAAIPAYLFIAIIA